jgi:UDP-N-acetylglucosamine 2-epimerase (non-hydrolysing)
MSKKKIMVIIGTRPEATKMVPVVLELKKHAHWFDTQLVVTGQHKEQMEQSLRPFNLVPDVDLNIMKPNQTLTYVTTSAISGLDELMIKDRPDLVLVHGDTQAAFCGATTAFFHQIPVAHVEAGLRSHNKYSPYPEEINRKLVDVISDIYFAPTELNRENLLAEGYKENIYVTGQTAVDVALTLAKENYSFINPEFNRIYKHKGRLISMTAHRRENLGEPMENMFRAIKKLVDENEDVLLVYPVHLNPKVRVIANKYLANHDRILLTEPAEFPDMINLISRSYMLVSDSGGLQEESTVFHKPMILMRDTTERPEAVEAGSVFLSGTDEDVIYNFGTQLLNDQALHTKMSTAKNPFGDGKASQRIVRLIANHYGLSDEVLESFIC